MARGYSLLSGADVEYPELELEPVDGGISNEEAAKRVAHAERCMAEAERQRDSAVRSRVAAESELTTMSARVQALNSALIQSEERNLAERGGKEAALSQCSVLRAEIDRLSSQLESMTSVSQFADELRNHMSSNAAEMRTLVSVRPNGAPTFELSFSRDSTGRIKSPVTAAPKAQ